VLEFRVPSKDLAELHGLDLATSTQRSVARFVRHNRLGGGMHEFDFVEGPMLANPGQFLRGRPPSFFGQQTSFHSSEALGLLERSLVR